MVNGNLLIKTEAAKYHNRKENTRLIEANMAKPLP
jgi:hypothetical protein